MIGFVKKFDDKKTMSFKVADKKLLKHQNMEKSLMNKEFDSEPVYGDNDEYIKRKIKIY